MTFLVTIREKNHPLVTFQALKCPVLAKVETQNSTQMHSLSLPSTWDFLWPLEPTLCAFREGQGF